MYKFFHVIMWNLAFVYTDKKISFCYDFGGTPRLQRIAFKWDSVPRQP